MYIVFFGPLVSETNIMHLRRQYDPTYQLLGHVLSDNHSSSPSGGEPLMYSLGSLLLWLGFIIILGSLTYFGYRTINRTRLKSDSECPFDPYLKSKNTSLDASLIAATEPSFKHTTIPSPAYCASKPCSNGEFEWFNGPQVSGPVSQLARARFVSGEMSCYPRDFQNECSTPNRLWKSSKHVSSPPIYLQSEGTAATIVEKEAQSKVSRIV